jgi:hypothetical protein
MKKIRWIFYFVLVAVPLFPLLAMSKQVKSFDELKNVEKYEDLEGYGLVPPQSHNHIAGTNLILLALKVSSFQKGDWVMAHGLLGATMLDASIFDRAGYQNLFLSLCDRSKYLNSATNQNSWAWPKFSGQKFSLVDTKSIVVKRENIMGYLTWQIESRFEYDKKGNYKRVYTPDPNRPEEKNIYLAFQTGLKIYEELTKKGVEDKCLRNLLGMISAVLIFDQLSSKTFISEQIEIGQPIQLYIDALAATINGLKEKPEHSKIFLEALYWETDRRGIGDTDTYLFPENDKSLKALLNLVELDLKQIDQKTSVKVDASTK